MRILRPFGAIASISTGAWIYKRHHDDKTRDKSCDQRNFLAQPSKKYTYPSLIYDNSLISCEREQSTSQKEGVLRYKQETTPPGKFIYISL